MWKTKSTDWPLARIIVFGSALFLAVALVGSVIAANIPPDGRLRVIAVPGVPSPFFGGFRPESRVVTLPNVHAELKDEPIYFSLAALPFFRRVVVRMEYRNLGQPVMELGARTSPGVWSFILKPIEADGDSLDGIALRESFLSELAATPPPKRTEDGWSISETAFDMSALAVDRGGDVQMIISLPGMKSVKAPILIRKVEIEYIRPPLTLNFLLEALRKRLIL